MLSDMGIVDEDVSRVRQSVDIVGLISEHVLLKRVGRRWVGLCPFHNEKSPSFSVNQEMGVYYCFGCGAKGDAISFVRELEHLDFVNAVEKLAGKAGVELRYTEADSSEYRKRRSKLVDVVGGAVEFYHNLLRSSPEAGRARAYLRERGFTKEEVEKYKLGWAPSYGGLLKHFSVSGSNSSGNSDGFAGSSESSESGESGKGGDAVDSFVLRDAGLVVIGDDGKARDFFRGRILFPIFTAAGEAVAFGGRILPDADFKGPKYKNSSSSFIYDKSRVLYGLNWAKGEIVRKDRVVLCEGYVDVVGFHAVGVGEAVATCGTALTEEHIKMLVNYTREFVLAFDADAAGQAAAARILEWEREYGLSLKVVKMPAGSDPGELARTSPDVLREAVETASPFLKFRVDNIISGYDLDSVESRVRAADAAKIIIDEHPDSIVRDQYLMELAEALNLSATDLRDRKPPPGAVASQRASQAPQRAAYGMFGEGEQEVQRRPVADIKELGLQDNSPELEALRSILENPKENAPIFHESVFMNENTRVAFRALRDAQWIRDKIPDTTPEVIVDLIDRLTVQENTISAIEVLERLVFVAGNHELQILTQRSKTAQGEDLLLIAEQVRWLKHQLELMRDNNGVYEALPEILEWLTEQHDSLNDSSQ